MATIDFDYEINTDTDKQGGGGIIPHSYARIWAEAIDFPETRDGKGRQAAITFEVQEPEDLKGKKFWAYWTMLHSDEWKNGAYKYGKSQFDRFCRAVQVVVEKGTDSDELLFKTFVAEIGIQVGNQKPDGSYYSDKNQIDHFYYSDDDAKEPIPELGIIGDGTVAPKPATKPVAANQNAKPAAAATGAATGKTPWGKKAA